MQQTNRENAKGWQTQVEGGTANIADKIVQNFYNNSARKAGVPFQMPPLPAHFVERPEYEQPLKAKLLSEDAMTPGTLVVSAIHGLGGIGKSVLATKLAHDKAVQQRFEDGVLWVTLGQKPDLLPQLTGWIRALGDSDYPATTLEAATAHLRTLLYDKAVLLVVDDVWHPEHVQPFQVGSDRCRLLITTRRADVADEADAELYELDVMSDAQSLALLSARLNRTLGAAERAEAAQLAKAVGYLPIALDLVAARIKRGVSWQDLCQALAQEVARLEAIEGPQRRKGETRLEASFNLSLSALQEEIPEIWQHFVWLGVLPEDVLVVAPMVATLWDVAVAEASEQLELLWNDALLLPGSQIRVKECVYKSYRIHDLLHDVACRRLTAALPGGLGLTLVAAHRAWLERYQANTAQGQWHTLPDDGYIHAHLSWHLEQAQQLDRLHQLLQETTSAGRNGWYEACDQLGQTANFVTDVARAWQVAEQQYEQDPAQSIALQLRYALIRTTLNSLAKNIPAELMAALVEKRVWFPAQALTYAQQAQESSKRAAILQALAPHLPASLLPVALEVARSIQAESSRAEALRGLAPYLTAELLPEALAVARLFRDGSSRAKALIGLAPYLPEVIPEALAVARSIQDESSRASALIGLAQYLPAELLPEALAVARSIQDRSSRASALIGLAQYLPAELLPETLGVARSFRDEYSRASALRGLAQYLPAELLPEALAVARSFQDESSRASALIGLAPHLPEVIPEALAVARSIQDESSRASALIGLAQYLPAGLLPEALAVARSFQDESSRASALIGLAPYLPEVIPEALAVARSFQDESSRASALRRLAPYLPAELLPEALAVARSIQDESSRASALIGLAQYLPAELLPEALAVARLFRDEYSRASAFIWISPSFARDYP